jgi:hypothetical protein
MGPSMPRKAKMKFPLKIYDPFIFEKLHVNK